VDTRPLIGRSPERLSLKECVAFAGTYVAFEIYTPAATPLRVIEAAGDSVAKCFQQLKARALDPARFEILRIVRPY
jgi:hypothetical protein